MYALIGSDLTNEQTLELGRYVCSNGIRPHQHEQTGIRPYR